MGQSDDPCHQAEPTGFGWRPAGREDHPRELRSAVAHWVLCVKQATAELGRSKRDNRLKLAEGLEKAFHEVATDATHYAFANTALGALHPEAGKDWKSLLSIYEDLIEARHLNQPLGRPVTFVLYAKGRGRLSMWQLWVRVPLPPGDVHLLREMPTVLHGSVITDLSARRSHTERQTSPSPALPPTCAEPGDAERPETVQAAAVADSTARSETPVPIKSSTHPELSQAGDKIKPHAAIGKSAEVVVVDLTSKHLSPTALVGHSLLQALLPILVLAGC